MRILFIQFKRLGDVLMVTPAVKALKRSYPQATLHFLVEQWGLPAIQHNPLIDEIIVADRLTPMKRLWKLREGRYDVAVDFQNTPRSARWAWISGARLRIGFPKRGRAIFYNRRVLIPHADTYSAEEKLFLLTPLQIKSNLAIPELYVNQEEAERAMRVLDSFSTKRSREVIALSPVSRKRYKRWPAEHYSAVCDYLYEKRHFSFLPLFGRGEEPLVEEVIAHARHPEAFLYPYTPISFGGLKILIEHCLFYLGNDNGVRHVAIACGKPTATIFGPINPLNWTPPDNKLHRYAWSEDTVASITPQQVITMLSDLILSIGK